MTAEKKRYTTHITIETHEIKIIRTNGKPLSVFCESCQTTVSAFTPTQIAAFFRLALINVCQLIEAGEFHLVGTGRSIALICGNSLNDKIANLKNRE